MTYNDTPLPTDLISDSQPDIRENFQLLEDSQVVDEGSTADGNYIRYENGWQVCFHEGLTDEGPSSFNDQAFQIDWDYPVSFSTEPFVGGFTGRDSIKDGANTFDSSNDNLYLSSSLYVRRRNVEDSRLWLYRHGDLDFEPDHIYPYLAFAIGRWK